MRRLAAIEIRLCRKSRRGVVQTGQYTRRYAEHLHIRLAQVGYAGEPSSFSPHLAAARMTSCGPQNG